MQSTKGTEHAEGAYVLEHWLDHARASTVYGELAAEVAFAAMHSHGSPVPRLVAVQHLASATADVPIYRHPADVSPPSLPFTPTVAELVRRINDDLGTGLNHALIQLYRSGEDSISEHSDKTIDLVPGSVVVNLSFGATRAMTLQYKANKDIPVGPRRRSGRSDGATGGRRENITLTLPHNSVFVMDLCTNARWTHAIRPDRRLRLAPSPNISEEGQVEDEVSTHGPSRISLTLREIGTFVTPDDLIYGTGGTGGTREQAVPVDRTDAAWQDLLDGFGRENRGRDIDFASYYRAGSNAFR